MAPQLIDCLLFGVQLLREPAGRLQSGVRFFQFQLILIDFIFQLRVPAPLLHQALLMQLVGRLQSLIVLFCFLIRLRISFIKVSFITIFTQVSDRISHAENRRSVQN